MIDLKGMSDKFKENVADIIEVLHSKANSKSLGKKWSGTVEIKVNIHAGGITNVDCHAIEKFNMKKR